MIINLCLCVLRHACVCVSLLQKILKPEKMIIMQLSCLFFLFLVLFRRLCSARGFFIRLFCFLLLLL